MKDQKSVKIQLLEKLNELIDHRIETSQSAIDSAKESKNNETKSSAGDKFETGRAMMQLEQDKNELQLSKTLQLKALLQQVDIKKTQEEVGFGSLVVTNQGKYFIAVGIGKVKIDDEICFAISLDSPIGKLLNGRKIGARVAFRENKIEVKEIL